MIIDMHPEEIQGLVQMLPYCTYNLKTEVKKTNAKCCIQGRGVHVTGVSTAYTFKLNKNILSE
jgi:hypothetical protein